MLGSPFESEGLFPQLAICAGATERRYKKLTCKTVRLCYEDFSRTHPVHGEVPLFSRQVSFAQG